MKTVALSVAAVLAALPLTSQAQEPYPSAPPAARQTYFAARLGAVVPQHEDVEGFDNGLAFDLALGRRLSPNVALEASVGRFAMSTSGTIFDPTLGTVDAEVQLAAIPVTATAKLIAPAGSLEIFGLVGAGVYFVEGSMELSDGVSSLSVSDDTTTFGFHFGGGFAAHLSPQVTLGLDLRYVVASEDTFDVEGRMDSLLVGGTLAFSF